MLQGARSPSPGSQMGVQGGVISFFWGPAGACLGASNKNRGSRGRALGVPKVALDGLGAILKFMKNNTFLLIFEPLAPPEAPNGRKKNVKWRTLMQVKNKRCQQKHQKLNGGSLSNKKAAKEPQRKQQRASKSYNHH